MVIFNRAEPDTEYLHFRYNRVGAGYRIFCSPPQPDRAQNVYLVSCRYTVQGPNIRILYYSVSCSIIRPRLDTTVYELKKISQRLHYLY